MTSTTLTYLTSGTTKWLATAGVILSAGMSGVLNEASILTMAVSFFGMGLACETLFGAMFKSGVQSLQEACTNFGVFSLTGLALSLLVLGYLVATGGTTSVAWIMVSLACYALRFAGAKNSDTTQTAFKTSSAV